MEDHCINSYSTWCSLVKDYLINPTSTVDSVLLLSLQGEPIHSFGEVFHITQEEFNLTKSLLTACSSENSFHLDGTKYTIVNRTGCKSLYATSSRRQSGVSLHMLDQALLVCAHNKKVIPGSFCETTYRFASIVTAL